MLELHMLCLTKMCINWHDVIGNMHHNSQRMKLDIRKKKEVVQIYITFCEKTLLYKPGKYNVETNRKGNY